MAALAFLLLNITAILVVSPFGSGQIAMIGIQVMHANLYWSSWVNVALIAWVLSGLIAVMFSITENNNNSDVASTSIHQLWLLQLFTAILLIYYNASFQASIYCIGDLLSATPLCKDTVLGSSVGGLILLLGCGYFCIETSSARSRYQTQRHEQYNQQYSTLHKVPTALPFLALVLNIVNVSISTSSGGPGCEYTNVFILSWTSLLLSYFICGRYVKRWCTMMVLGVSSGRGLTSGARVLQKSSKESASSKKAKINTFVYRVGSTTGSIATASLGESDYDEEIQMIGADHLYQEHVTAVLEPPPLPPISHQQLAAAAIPSRKQRDPSFIYNSDRTTTDPIDIVKPMSMKARTMHPNNINRRASTGSSATRSAPGSLKKLNSNPETKNSRTKSPKFNRAEFKRTSSPLSRGTDIGTAEKSPSTASKDTFIRSVARKSSSASSIKDDSDIDIGPSVRDRCLRDSTLAGMGVANEAADAVAAEINARDNIVAAALAAAEIEVAQRNRSFKKSHSAGSYEVSPGLEATIQRISQSCIESPGFLAAFDSEYPGVPLSVARHSVASSLSMSRQSSRRSSRRTRSRSSSRKRADSTSRGNPPPPPPPLDAPRRSNTAPSRSSSDSCGTVSPTTSTPNKSRLSPKSAASIAAVLRTNEWDMSGVSMQSQQTADSPKTVDDSAYLDENDDVISSPMTLSPSIKSGISPPPSLTGGDCDPNDSLLSNARTMGIDETTSFKTKPPTAASSKKIVTESSFRGESGKSKSSRSGDKKSSFTSESASCYSGSDEYAQGEGEFFTC